MILEKEIELSMRHLVFVVITVAFAASLLVGAVSAQGKISNFRMSDTPNGPPVTDFPSGTSVVYVIFDYAEAADTPIQVRVYDPKGQILFKETKDYTGEGTEIVEVSNRGVAYPDGAYVSQVRIGPEEYIVQSVEWIVGEVPTPQAVATVVIQQPGPAPLASSGPSTVTIVGAGVLLMVLIAVVVWAIRGFMTAS